MTEQMRWDVQGRTDCARVCAAWSVELCVRADKKCKGCVVRGRHGFGRARGRFMVRQSAAADARDVGSRRAEARTGCDLRMMYLYYGHVTVYLISVVLKVVCICICGRAGSELPRHSPHCDVSKARCATMAQRGHIYTHGINQRGPRCEKQFEAAAKSNLSLLSEQASAHTHAH
eukprot:6014859-Prymnesium_polylepis.2